MRRSTKKVAKDVALAQAAVDAVRSGAMSYRVASEAYSVSVRSIAERLKSEVRMDASVGAAKVLSLEEENSLEDAWWPSKVSRCAAQIKASSSEFSSSRLRTVAAPSDASILTSPFERLTIELTETEYASGATR